MANADVDSIWRRRLEHTIHRPKVLFIIVILSGDNVVTLKIVDKFMDRKQGTRLISISCLYYIISPNWHILHLYNRKKTKINILLQFAYTIEFTTSVALSEFFPFSLNRHTIGTDPASSQLEVSPQTKTF